MSLAVMPSAAGFEVLERVGTASCGRDSVMDRQALDRAADHAGKAVAL
jgi:hypothetical protein